MNRRVNLKMKYIETSDTELQAKAILLSREIDRYKANPKKFTDKQYVDLLLESDAIATELENRQHPRAKTTCIAGNLTLTNTNLTPPITLQALGEHIQSKVELLETDPTACPSCGALTIDMSEAEPSCSECGWTQ